MCTSSAEEEIKEPEQTLWSWKDSKGRKEDEKRKKKK